MKELEDKHYMFPETTSIVEESGLHMTRFVFDLNKLGQAILYKIKQLDDSVQDLYSRDKEKDERVVALEKEVNRLKNIIRINNLRTNEKRQPIDYGF